MLRTNVLHCETKNDQFEKVIHALGRNSPVQAAIPTTAVPTKTEQWHQNEINIVEQGELEAQRAESGFAGSLGLEC